VVTELMLLSRSGCKFVLAVLFHCFIFLFMPIIKDVALSYCFLVLENNGM